MMSRISLLLVLFALQIQTSFGQAIFAKGTDLWKNTQKIMVVELLEEDRSYVAALEKDILKETNAEDLAELKDELAAHRKFIDQYNKLIKEAVAMSWSHNDSIVFKGEKEVDMLRAKKDPNVVLLFYGESDGYTINLIGKSYDPAVSLPTLSYSRPGSPVEKPDIYMYLPFAGHRTEMSIKLGDLVTALELMSRQLKVIFESGEKRVQLKDLVQADIKRNCIHLSDQTVLFDKRFIGRKVTLEALDETFPGAFQASDLDEITGLIEAKSDQLVTMAIPLRIRRGTGGGNEIEFMKVIINISTFEFYMQHGAENGEDTTLYYSSKVLKKSTSCK